jgi:hypothetical protein
MLNRPVQRRSVPCAASRQILFAASEGGIEGGAEMTSSPCQASQAVASISSAKGPVGGHRAATRPGLREAVYFQFGPWLTTSHSQPYRHRRY